MGEFVACTPSLLVAALVEAGSRLARRNSRLVTATGASTLQKWATGFSAFWDGQLGQTPVASAWCFWRLRVVNIKLERRVSGSNG